MSSSVERKFVFWVVYDTTGDRQFVKMDSDTGCLAMFDDEESAAALASGLAGAGYKKVVLYQQPAPDVQGEPVAWVTADTVDGQAVNGKPRRVWWENNEGVGMPIYTAPQPAEQQECGCCGQTDRCDDDCDAVVIGGHRAAEQKEPDSLCVEDDGCPTERAVLQRFWRKHHQPAPDVAALVEALEWIAGVDCKPGEGDTDFAVAMDRGMSIGRICRKAAEALATHRKQGGDA